VIRGGYVSVTRCRGDPDIAEGSSARSRHLEILTEIGSGLANVEDGSLVFKLRTSSPMSTSTTNIAALLAAAVVACAAQSSESDTGASDQEMTSANSQTITFSPEKCTVANEFVGNGDTPTPAQVALDGYCGEQLFKRSAPNGWVVIFGSARLKSETPEYQNAKSFASLWTTAHGKQLPILTAAGGGIMEAGNLGAKEAGGPSLGAGTYFKDANDKMNAFVTDGYMFSDFEMRERALIRYAKAAVIYWGGVGTAWELFMTISDVQTKRLKKIPIILVGKDWTDAISPYFEYMKGKGLISADDMKLFKIVETPESTFAALDAEL
jgi:predicted Rossmann-fold nucleotide-binding protein